MDDGRTSGTAADLAARRSGWLSMDRGTAGERVAELSSELRRHNRLYHTLGTPEIDDREYDLLFRELTELEARFPDLAREDSPTRRVGGPPVDGLTPFPHRIPMLSLGNVFGADEVRDFEVRRDGDRVTGGLRMHLQRAGEDPEQPMFFTVEPNSTGSPWSWSTRTGSSPEPEPGEMERSGRHPQRADHSDRSPPAPRGCTPYLSVRGEAFRPSWFRPHECKARGTGREALRESPQCGCRDAAAPPVGGCAPSVDVHGAFCRGGNRHRCCTHADRTPRPALDARVRGEPREPSL